MIAPKAAAVIVGLRSITRSSQAGLGSGLLTSYVPRTGSVEVAGASYEATEAAGLDELAEERLPPSRMSCFFILL